MARLARGACAGRDASLESGAATSGPVTRTATEISLVSPERQGIGGRGSKMQRKVPWLLIAGAVFYQILLVCAIMVTLMFALVDVANGPVRLAVPGAPLLVEALPAVHVAGLILWALILLWLARKWRRCEHLRQLDILGRFILLSLPVYGLVRLLRMRFEPPQKDVQSGSKMPRAEPGIGESLGLGGEPTTRHVPEEPGDLRAHP